mgnify:CR=1 FL=1
MSKPICVDLCCGLGGWAEGFIAEGWDVIGFDIFDMAAETGLPRAAGMQLVLQDILTVTGQQFRGKVSCITASPPCQKFSYMAMPWTRAKAMIKEYEASEEKRRELTALFDACVRIGKEAGVPTIIENVRGAQRWIGRSRHAYGSFHLWGDVPALMPMTVMAQKFNPDGTAHGQGSWFGIADSKNRGTKNSGGSWFNIGSPGQKVTNQNPVNDWIKNKDADGYERSHPQAFGWKATRTSSKSSKRKAASALIAKIPLPLSRYIASVYKPIDCLP